MKRVELKPHRRRAPLVYKPPKPKPLPLPRDDELSDTALAVIMLLDRLDGIRAQLVAWQGHADAVQRALDHELSKGTELRRSYEAFVGSGGRTGSEFKRWVAMHGARQRGVTGQFLQLVVNNGKKRARR